MTVDTNNTAPARYPVVLITGFLGSGKTTLLAQLLRHPGMNNTAVIVNEFGEIGLDHMLVETPDEEMVLLNSGCLCCSIRGDLVNTLSQLLLRRHAGEIPAFDRVVVETTGLADPAPILHTVLTDEAVSPHFLLDSVVTVVDAVNGDGQLDRHFESVKQAAVADRIVLSKTDLATRETIDPLLGRLAKLNPGADILEVTQGMVEPDTLLNFGTDGRRSRQLDVADWLGENLEATEQPTGHHAPNDHHHHGHHGAEPHAHNHDADIRTFSIIRDAPVEPAGLELWLNMLSGFRGPNLLRVKGLLNVAGHPVVVHAVQHLFHDPVTLAKWPSDDRRSRIVFITHKLDQVEVEKTLQALDLSTDKSTDAPANSPFDPDTYEKFVKAMGSFGGSEKSS